MQYGYYLRNLTKVAAVLMPVVFGVIFSVSCLSDNFETDRLSERIGYTPVFVMPVAYGSLTLGNFVGPDDTLVFVGPDNLLSLVLREESLFSVSAADILKIPLPDPVLIPFMPKPVGLDDLVAGAGLTLDELTRRISEPEASQIRNSEGSTIVFPEIPWQDAGSVSAIFRDDFDYALFAGGYLELSVSNDFPVEVSMEIRLVNHPGGEEVATFVFEQIAPGESAVRNYSLEDVQVHHTVIAEIVGFSTASGEATIDLSDEIRLEVSARNLTAMRGRARIGKTLIDTGEALRDLPFDDEVQLDELRMSDGLVHYSLENFPPGVSLGVTLVNVLRGPDPKTFDIPVSEDILNMEGIYDLLDVEFDFSEYDKQIMFDFRLFAGSDSPEPVDFDLTRGEILLDMHCSDFNASFASGYFGMEEIVLDIDEFNLGLDFFDKISGDFRLTNPSVRVFYENSAGVPSELLFNMSAVSAGGDAAIDLFDADQQQFAIDFPEEPYSSLAGEIVISRETSNIVDIIALPPSNINIDASVIINPDGPGGAQNFVTSESNASFGLEFNLPMEMQLTDLGFADTLALDIEMSDIDMIETLMMILQVTNGFPLGASVDLSLYDSQVDRVLHGFGDLVFMDAATVDGDGMAIEGGEARSETEIEITGKVRDDLVRADHVIISARLNTGKNDDIQIPVKFQTTNSLDFRIRIRADLNINN
jgi:hypothetical protein